MGIVSKISLREEAEKGRHFVCDVADERFCFRRSFSVPFVRLVSSWKMFSLISLDAHLERKLQSPVLVLGETMFVAIERKRVNLPACDCRWRVSRDLKTPLGSNPRENSDSLNNEFKDKVCFSK